MRHRTARSYLATAALLVFLLLWVTVAAKPWSSPVKPAADPRLVALNARQRHLQQESAIVKRLVAKRWAVYQHRLAARRRQIDAAKRAYADRVAAAQAAAYRIAAAQAAARAASQTQVSASASASASVSQVSRVTPVLPAQSSAAASAPAVVAPPPQVQVVTLPPVTRSSSSKP
jgi:hypothetical protein